jgi:murein DD-endopeptidase MepM/ murein hydrolase activator NlpD
VDRGDRYDVLIGHAARVLVDPGDRVRPGQVIARAGARGAPDGCHLHFEQRRPDGGVASAVDPTRLLALRPV